MRKLTWVASLAVIAVIAYVWASNYDEVAVVEVLTIVLIALGGAFGLEKLLG